MLSQDMKSAAEQLKQLQEAGTTAVLRPKTLQQWVERLKDWAAQAEAMEKAPIPLHHQRDEDHDTLGPFEPGGAA